MCRRRECVRCGGRFTTGESVEQRPLQVLKRDGSAEDFLRDKLQASIATACVERPVSPSDIEALVEKIKDALLHSARVEISSAMIGEAVMEAPEPLGRIAYIRYGPRCTGTSSTSTNFRKRWTNLS